MTHPNSDRPAEKGRLSRAGSRIVTARLTASDRRRLAHALDSRGVSVSGYVRGLILSDLEGEADMTT